MRTNKKIFSFLALLSISAVLPMTLQACTTFESNSQTQSESVYNVVSPDFQMSESLAILGVTPSLVTSNWTQSDYNTFDTQTYKNIAFTTNDEALFSFKPKIFMYYDFDNPILKQKVESYGGAYISYPKISTPDFLNYGGGPNSVKQPLRHGWDSVKAFWTEFNGLLWDQRIDNVYSKLENHEVQFNKKVSVLKELIRNKYSITTNTKINVSTWGANVGINYGIAADDFKNFGFDTGQIDWMFGDENSLGFINAKPATTDIEYKAAKVGSNAFTSIGWFNTSNNMPTPEQTVQQKFYSTAYKSGSYSSSNIDQTAQPSDIVFVKYDGKDEIKIKELKDNFKQIAKNNEENRVIIIPTNIAFYEYSPITWEYVLNTLYDAFGFNQRPNDVKTDLSVYKQNLKSLADFDIYLKTINKNMIKEQQDLII